MVEQFSWERVGQLVGSAILAIGAALAVLRGHNKSDGKVPLKREPSVSEIRECLRDIKRLVERHKEFGDDAVDRIENQLDTILRRVERMEHRLEDITRILERVDAAQRFEHAALRWRNEANKGESQ